MQPYVKSFEELRKTDIESVGGKNASLGEMISNLSGLGVTVPDGFATTAQAYRDFLAGDGLGARINERLDRLDVDDVDALVRAGADIRGWIREAPLPERLLELSLIHI